ncbi:MAG TPA: amidohydrolase family protein [Caulobacteraceae bacterium]|nr:amidohydrolase family protein [Caulobacteraceae bacterium]
MIERLIRGVEVEGRAGCDVRLRDGTIAEIGHALASRSEEIDGHGGALIPGLADHHIHLFALAAQAASVRLDDVTSAAELAARITAAAVAAPAGAWIRATGYHEGAAGDLSCRELDALAPRHPVRVQHRTGALWVLNSLALAALGTGALPDFVERDARGAPTGRIWRGDAWLRERLGAEPPPLAPVGRQLAAFGVTAVTDASVTTDADAAGRLAAAHRAGALPQRLMLMSGGALAPPADGAFTVGPVKVLLDDHALPDLDDFIARIAAARVRRRNVAVHCVTAGEFALTLAAFRTAGTEPGDRIEHGGVIPGEAIGELRTLGLTVVTQPAFVRERGDRYLAEVDPVDQPDLYRCASLREAGVPVAGSSDAPYATPDPWVGIAAAVQRTTRSGQRLGEAERVLPAAALGLYLGALEAPAGRPRRVAVGAPADLCLLGAPMREALAATSADVVRATLIGGEVVFAGR